MADITVDETDLKFLVQRLYEASVDARSERSVRIKLLGVDIQAAQRWEVALESLTPQAQIEEAEIFRDLFSSFESGGDVRSSLASFVAPARRSSMQPDN